MGPGFRKLMLAAHIVSSVGWLGAVAAYIPLDVTAAASDDVETLRAVYVGMGLIAQWAIVPLAIAAFATGLVVSLGTPWGLFRHYWVIVSLVLTLIAVVVLLIEMQTIRYYADTAANAATSPEGVRALGNTLGHSIGGSVVLLVTLALNVYKPRGMTRYGWRKQQAERTARE